MAALAKSCHNTEISELLWTQWQNPTEIYPISKLAEIDKFSDFRNLLQCFRKRLPV